MARCPQTSQSSIMPVGHIHSTHGSSRRGRWARTGLDYIAQRSPAYNTGRRLPSARSKSLALLHVQQLGVQTLLRTSASYPRPKGLKYPFSSCCHESAMKQKLTLSSALLSAFFKSWSKNSALFLGQRPWECLKALHCGHDTQTKTVSKQKQEEQDCLCKKEWNLIQGLDQGLNPAKIS